MNERVFVANDVTGRPPRGEVRMRRLGAQDGFETGFVRRIVAIAILQFVHALETEADASFGAVDFPPVVIFMAGSEPSRFERSVSAFSHIFAGSKFCEKSSRVVHGDFFDAFAGRSLQTDRLRFARPLLNECFLQVQLFQRCHRRESGPYQSGAHSDRRANRSRQLPCASASSSETLGPKSNPADKFRENGESGPSWPESMSCLA